MILLIVGAILALFLTVILVFLATRAVIHLVQALQQPTLPRSTARSVKESRHYGRLITKIVQQYPPGPMRDRLQLTIRPVEDWLARLNKLEQELGKLYSQRNLKRELRQTQYDIEELRRQLLNLETAETAWLSELMESKKNHLAALKELEVFQTQAEYKIRKIASDLGAAHAEMLLLSARGDFNDNRLRRLDENLQDNMDNLRDLMSAMDEMGYSRSAAG